MKVPRDISGADLVNKLKDFGYEVTRQKGSHIRLSKTLDNGIHHLTVPNHSPIKIGTLNSIIKDIAEHNKLTKETILNKLL